MDDIWVECGQCDAKFLSVEALNGHLNVHGGRQVVLHE